MSKEYITGDTADQGIPERGEVVATVSEHSRSVARIPIHKQVERLVSDKEQLGIRKRDLEAELAKIAGWKRSETAKILSRPQNKSQSIQATNQLESDYLAKRIPLIDEIRTIELQIRHINGSLTVAKRTKQSDPRQPREDVEILRRIEKLLIILVERSRPDDIDFTGAEL